MSFQPRCPHCRHFLYLDTLVCPNCEAGDYGRCDRVTVGDLKPGLQTGYCADTGGGWSRMMLVHRSQIWAVPSEMDDRAAVLVEPLA